jgi:hypothetical protein
MADYIAGAVGGQRGIPQAVRIAETPLSGHRSIAVALPDTGRAGLRPFSVHTVFAGAPGAFEDDLQVADNDVDAQYTSAGLTGSVVNAVDTTNNAYHVEFNTSARFVRVLTKTQNANSVAQTTIKPE